MSLIRKEVGSTRFVGESTAVVTTRNGTIRTSSQRDTVLNKPHSLIMFEVPSVFVGRRFRIERNGEKHQVES